MDYKALPRPPREATRTQLHYMVSYTLADTNGNVNTRGSRSRWSQTPRTSTSTRVRTTTTAGTRWSPAARQLPATRVGGGLHRAIDDAVHRRGIDINGDGNVTDSSPDRCGTPSPQERRGGAGGGQRVARGEQPGGVSPTSAPTSSYSLTFAAARHSADVGVAWS